MPLLVEWVNFDIAELINRLRALTLALLPVEVDPKSISGHASRIITPQVVSAYRNAAGDFVEAVSDFVGHHFNILTLMFSYLMASYVPERSLFGMRIIIQQTMVKILGEVNCDGWPLYFGF